MDVHTTKLSQKWSGRIAYDSIESANIVSAKFPNALLPSASHHNEAVAGKDCGQNIASWGRQLTYGTPRVHGDIIAVDSFGRVVI